MYKFKEIPDTVNQSMTSAISLLHPIAVMNSDEALQTLYFEPERGVALAGFRREVANFGVCLVKAQYGSNNEVQINDWNYVRRPGLIHYGRPGEYFETDEGLLGSEIKEGYREGVNIEKADEKIGEVKFQVKDEYEVGLNPEQIYKFMQHNITQHNESQRDRKVNLQFTAESLPQGHLVATVEVFNGEKVMMTPVPVNGRMEMVTLHIHQDSRIHVTRLQPRVLYLVKPKGVDQKTGKRYVDVLRPHYEGIRIAMQSFKMGIIKPGDPGYDVNPDPNNGLLNRHVRDLAFMQGQKKKRIAGAPMMTFDLDMFYALMEVFNGYPVVVMQFKNSTTGVYFRAEGNEYMPTIEAIMGPTIQHVRGRVWLP